MREQLGEQHPVYAAFLNNRAALYVALGNLTVAESDYRKALDLKRKIYGPDAITVGASLRNLASLVYKRNASEGEKLFQEAVDLYAKNPKAPPFEFTGSLLGLAEAQLNRGDVAGARETLQRASDAALKGLGKKHPLYAAVLRDQGLVHQSAHEYAEAEQQLQAAIAIVEETHGKSHPDLARYWKAWLLCSTKRATIAPPNLSIAAAWISQIEPWPTCSPSVRSATRLRFSRIFPTRSRRFSRFRVEWAIGYRRLARWLLKRSRGGKGQLLDLAHDWGQSLRENSDSNIRIGFQSAPGHAGVPGLVDDCVGLSRSKAGRGRDVRVDGHRIGRPLRTPAAQSANAVGPAR